MDITDPVYNLMMQFKEKGEAFLGPALVEVLNRLPKPKIKTEYLPLIVEVSHEEVKSLPAITRELPMESASFYKYFPFAQGMVKILDIPKLISNPAIVGVFLDRKLKNMVFAMENDKKRLGELKISKVKKVTLAQTLTTMGVKSLHEVGIDGKGIKIAVLDTGANPEHPMIKPNLIHMESVNPDEPDPIAHNPHGPWCLSAAGGAYVNSDEYGEMFGAAPKASLISIKVLDKSGSGAISTIIKGIERAIDLGADVLSLSLGAVLSFGGTTPDDRAVDLATLMHNKNIVVAAGNSGALASIASPGDARFAITVGSVGYLPPWRYSPSMFSSKGPTMDRRIKPDFTAFGGDLYGNIIEMIVGASDMGDNYEAEAGTSMATPQLAGAIALLHQLMHKDIRLGNREFIENLLKTVSHRPVPLFFKDILEGWGTPNMNLFASEVR